MMNRIELQNPLWLVLTIVMLSSCGGQTEEGGHGHDHPTVEEQPDTNYVPIENQRQSLIHCNGRVEVPPQYVADIHARIDGYVEDVYVLKGQEVKRGQALAVISDRTILTLRQELQQSNAKLERIQKSYDRKSVLFESKAISSREWEEVKAQLDGEKALNQSLKDQLSYIGIDPEAVAQAKGSDKIMITSPIEGFVNAVNVNMGKRVSAHEKLFQVIDESHKHIELEVFPSAAGALKMYQRVEFTPTGSNETYEGYVFLINRSVDAMSNTINVHVHPEGETKNLVVSTFVDAKIHTDEFVEEGDEKHAH